MTAKESKKSGIKHECELEETEGNEFTIADVFTRGPCAMIKRFFMSQILIWRYNSRSIKTYKSDFVIKRENIKQLKMRTYVIHPFSKFRLWWEIIMVYHLLLAFLMPLNKLFMIEFVGFLNVQVLLMQFVDMVLTFNTGYQIMRTSQVIMSRKKIAIHYLRTWFVPHLISCVGDVFQYFAIQNRHIVWWKYFENLTLFRIEMFFRYIHNIEAYQDSYTHRRRGIFLAFILFFTILWTVNLMYISDRHKKIIHLKVFKNVWHDLFFHGISTVQLVNAPIRNEMITCIVGFILKITVLGYFIRIFRKFHFQRFKFIDKLQQLENYASAKKICPKLRRKMLDYLYHMDNQCKFEEKKVQCELSSTLRREVLIYQNSNLLEKSYVFQNLPMNICYKLTAKLIKAVYAPSDVVVSFGTVINKMFFIKTGVVALYTQSGREICHLYDGASFGEMFLVEEAPRTPIVVTIDWCELCFLNMSDILDILEGYPELLQEIRYTIRKRAAKAPTDVWDFEGYAQYDITSENDSNVTEKSLSSFQN